MQQHRNFLFLCARPSFLEGLARIMDFGQTLNEYNSSPSAQEADFAAIAEDFADVFLFIRPIYSCWLLWAYVILVSGRSSSRGAAFVVSGGWLSIFIRTFPFATVSGSRILPGIVLLRCLSMRPG